ncbi:MAG: hypothetical protein CL776_03315 [Chloroflexi bacterium]|nr:hypothetical protein [Chloroflexota bacterium]
MIFVEPLKHYADFQGRSSRAEYWSFGLAQIVLIAALLIIDGSGILFTLAFLALMIPNLAVSVRRLHDTNKTGWMVLLGLIPFVGSIVLLVLYLLPGNIGDNDYGAQPSK